MQRWAMMLVGRVWRQVERLTAAGGCERVRENGMMVKKYFEDLLASTYLAAGATQLVRLCFECPTVYSYGWISSNQFEHR